MVLFYLLLQNNSIEFHTGAFRKASRSLVSPWALIFGGLLYGTYSWSGEVLHSVCIFDFIMAYNYILSLD